MKRALLVLLVSIAAGWGYAADPTQKLYRTNRQGNEAYRQKDFEKAQEKYDQAQQLAPRDPRIAYNQGTVATARGNAEDAKAAYDRALQSAEGSLRRDTWYNRGVTALQQKEWPQAVKSFGEALKLDASDADARRNLELAVRQLQRQQQQQQQQSKPKQPPKAGQQPQPQPQSGSGDKQQQQQPQQDPQADGSAADNKQQQQQQPGPGDQQQKQGRPPSAGDSDRLLDQLRNNETKALQRALKRDNRKPDRRGSGDLSRDKDW
ncbi:MAG: tetratricopeptide repeat protein [Acidobacteriota bacterium]